MRENGNSGFFVKVTATLEVPTMKIVAGNGSVYELDYLLKETAYPWGTDEWFLKVSELIHVVLELPLKPQSISFYVFQLHKGLVGAPVGQAVHFHVDGTSLIYEL